MVNERQLRVGNYILRDGEPYRITKLKDILDPSEPIPLTQWLIIKVDAERQFEFPIRLPYYFHDIHIKYFHQLQNLYFALTGKEMDCQGVEQEISLELALGHLSKEAD